MLGSIFYFATEHWAAVLFILFIAYSLRNRFHHGLHRYPGPFLASLTDWSRFFDVLGRRPDIAHINLHKQYGDIVRLGPNVLSFANLAAIKAIYGLNQGFSKQAMAKGMRLPSLFSTTDEQFHAQLRKSVQSTLSMSALVQYEPWVDDKTATFLDKQKVGQIPVLDLFLLKNPILRMLDRFDLNPFTSAVAKFAQARIGEWVGGIHTAKTSGHGANTTLADRGDLLSMFLKATAEQPGFFYDGRVLVMAVSMAFAGSDTTVISLAAVFYYLVKTPESYRKLVEKIDGEVTAGVIEDRPNGLVSWTESQRLPYLDACIKEAFRLHPAVGLPLERIVPEQGAEICGEHIAGGTIVGSSAWVIHRRPEVFGDDVDVYRA
ncbi:MAG: hypothetical protein Q9173_003423 [Seirophora scorigena]